MKREESLIAVLSALAELQEIKFEQQRLTDKIIETLLQCSDAIRNHHTFQTYMAVLNLPSNIRQDVYKALRNRKYPPDEPIRMAQG